MTIYKVTGWLSIALAIFAVICGVWRESAVYLLFGVALIIAFFVGEVNRRRNE